MLKTKRNEVHMAVVLLALIILPSGLLGYFSWRAIGHEQLLAQERLRESYRQFALLAAREIDETLKKVEKGWVAAVQGIIKPDMQRPAAEDFAELMGKEPLIAASFLLTAPGTVAYPPDLSIREESASPESWEKDAYIHEYDIFNKLVAQSEELEYRAYDLDGALAGYHEILSQVSNLQLRGTAESYIGRVLMKKATGPQRWRLFTRCWRTIQRYAIRTKCRCVFWRNIRLLSASKTWDAIRRPLRRFCTCIRTCWSVVIR